MILYLRNVHDNIIPIYYILLPLDYPIQTKRTIPCSLYLFLSSVDTDLDVNAKGIYLTSSHLPSPKVKRMNESEKRKAPRLCDMRCALIMEEGKKKKKIQTSAL